jgi:2-polyprenyl-3-methyl-5-hydroxy-6-metoxy-1,4-benzoquinol methylase
VRYNARFTMRSSEVRTSAPEPGLQWPAGGLEWLGCCPVCEGTERRELYRDLRDRVFFCAPGAWTLQACQGCGVAYLDPRPTVETIGLAYSSYVTHHAAERPASEGMGIVRRWRRGLANGYRNWRYGTQEHPANRLGIALAYLLPHARAPLDLEFRHLPRHWPGARVLDVGSGNGGFLQWAAAAGWDAVGVDPDPAAVVAARVRGLKIHLGTLTDMQEESPFDVITANHVIEHVHDPRAFLEGVRTLLKPGGTLWLETPNLSSLGHEMFGPAWLGLDPPRHLVLFTSQTLRELLRATGFRVVRQLPRPEVCQTTFAVSQAIADSSGNPLADGALSLPLRLRAHLAGWRARITPERAEFLTVLAVREG